MIFLLRRLLHASVCSTLSFFFFCGTYLLHTITFLFLLFFYLFIRTISDETDRPKAGENGHHARSREAEHPAASPAAPRPGGSPDPSTPHTRSAFHANTPHHSDVCKRDTLTDSASIATLCVVKCASAGEPTPGKTSRILLTIHQIELH